MEMHLLCRACGASARADSSFSASDHRYRPENSYTYFKCIVCGSYSLADGLSQEQLSQFYYQNYETHKNKVDPVGSRGTVGLVRALARRAAIKAWIATSGSKQKLQSAFRGVTGPYTNWCEFRDQNSPGRLLDVGAGGGFFAAKMRDLGWNVTAVEPDKNALVHGIRGVRSILGSIYEVPNNETFSQIVFNHTIEHMLDPRAQLRHAYQLLEVGGKITLVTPNAGSVLFVRKPEDHWHLDAPRHVCIYSRQGLLELSKLKNASSSVYFSYRANSTTYRKTKNPRLQYVSAGSLQGNKSLLASFYQIAGMLDFTVNGRFREELILVITKGA